VARNQTGLTDLTGSADLFGFASQSICTILGFASPSIDLMVAT
jgi:hypothetical protein